MGYKEAAANNRKVSSKEWIEKSRAADYAANGNAAKSTAQYTATIEEEEKARQGKGVFLEFRNGVYTEVLCRSRAISAFNEGSFIVFSKQDIDALTNALELNFSWCSDDKKTYQLIDVDGLKTMYSVSNIEQGLKVYHIPKTAKNAKKNP
jgi:hypothetical protein